MSTLQHAVKPFDDLVDESVDEAAFLWRRWESELTSPTRSLDEVYSWTEDRLHGALDGVRAAGSAAIDVATQGLRSDELGRVSVSTSVLSSVPDRAATDALMAALGSAEGARLAAMMRGLELLGSDQALRTAAPLLAARGPAGIEALCRLKTFRRAQSGDEIEAAFRSGIPAVQSVAVAAAGYASSRVPEEWIATAMRSDDPTVRAAAIASGVTRGMKQALEAAVLLARPLDEHAGSHLKLVAMLGTAAEQDIVYAALRVQPLRRDAIWALAHIGTMRAVEACVAGMRHEAFARQAGEAYCWITGADLVRDRLAVDEPAPEVPAFEDDNLDADLVPSPEALWPLPDPDAVRRDWDSRRPGFTGEQRHIHGRPVTMDTLLAMVETGPMLRRPDLLLELHARTRGRYDVEPRAFAARQSRMMSAGRAALTPENGR